VDSLQVKLRALNSMFDKLQSVQKREAGVTATVLLSLIDWIKSESPPLHMRYSQFQAFAYSTHGLNEGTQESARRAVVHYEKSLQGFEAIGFARGIAIAKNNIALAKSKYEGGYNKEEMLRSVQKLYELRVTEYGEEHEYTK
jgi:hypothetical protein